MATTCTDAAVPQQRVHDGLNGNNMRDAQRTGVLPRFETALAKGNCPPYDDAIFFEGGEALVHYS
ncbi:MAG: hypothetical protein NVS4B8_13600 [Herpetosiphon sp.]